MAEFLLSAFISTGILFMIILLTTLRIKVHIRRKDKDDEVTTNIKAWFGLINIKTNIPVIQIEKDLSGTEYKVELESQQETIDKSTFKARPSEILQLHQRIYNWMKQVHGLLQIVKKLLKTIRLDKLEWRTDIGTSDAAETGVVTGLVWGIKSSIVGLITSSLTLRGIPRLHVQPHFQERKIETELICIFRFRIGNAILAGIRILLNLRKRRDKKWQSTQFRA